MEHYGRLLWVCTYKDDDIDAPRQTDLRFILTEKTRVAPDRLLEVRTNREDDARLQTDY